MLFALSLAKGNPRIFKGFDRLSPNGFESIGVSLRRR